MFRLIFLIVSLSSVQLYVIEPRPYTQCGGLGWTGSTVCPDGFYCSEINPWYSQCIPGESTSTRSPSTTSRVSTTNNCLQFTKGGFKVGISYDRRSEVAIPDYDYVTIWMNTIDGSGSTAWNKWYQGEMLNLCKLYRKTPLFYAYVIAFEARASVGLQDCDVNPTFNLCHKGSNYIRQNRTIILQKYNEHALNIADVYGTSDPVIFVIEPDFWQYYGDYTQEGGPLSGDYMKDLFADISRTIRSHLPKAMISWDISAWIGESGFKTWWGFFKDLDIDFIHTSGGQARGDSASIKPGELSWSFVSSTTGKKIIADCGYAVAGQQSSNCDVWSNTANQNARVQDGVISLSVAKPEGYVARPGVSC